MEIIAYIFCVLLLFALIYEHTRYTRQKKEIEYLTAKIDSFIYVPEKLNPEVLKEGYIANLNNEITILEKRFLEVLEEAKTNETEMSRFVENMAHQIKNMLTSVQIQLDLVEKRCLLEQNTNIIKCREAIERLAGDMDMILNSGLLAEGRIDMKDERMDIGEVVASVINSISSIALEHNVTMVSKCDETITICGDRYWIFQALQNLVKNATEHAGENGSVYVGAFEENGYLKITVEDDGKGIAPDEQKKLFRRFFRGNTKKSGYGLGLSMAKDISIAHHGTVTAESSERGGACFVIRLPLLHKEDIYPA